MRADQAAAPRASARSPICRPPDAAHRLQQRVPAPARRLAGAGGALRAAGGRKPAAWTTSWRFAAWPAGALDVTDVYSTDAEIARYNLRVLADDRGYFPHYEAILLYRRDAEARWPAAFAAWGG